VTAAVQPIDLAEKLGKIDKPWTPKIVAELNGQHVKLAKLEGEFIWHRHDAEDELFLVLEGRLVMEFRDRPTVTLEKGQMLVVPKGVEHKPVAENGASVLLFEPASTLNTGNVTNERTLTNIERI